MNFFERNKRNDSKKDQLIVESDVERKVKEINGKPFAHLIYSRTQAVLADSELGSELDRVLSSSDSTQNPASFKKSFLLHPETPNLSLRIGFGGLRNDQSEYAITASIFTTQVIPKSLGTYSSLFVQGQIAVRRIEFNLTPRSAKAKAFGEVAVHEQFESRGIALGLMASTHLMVRFIGEGLVRNMKIDQIELSIVDASKSILTGQKTRESSKFAKLLGLTRAGNQDGFPKFERLYQFN